MEKNLFLFCVNFFLAYEKITIALAQDIYGQDPIRHLIIFPINIKNSNKNPNKQKHLSKFVMSYHVKMSIQNNVIYIHQP